MYNRVYLTGIVSEDSVVSYSESGKPYIRVILNVYDYLENPIKGLDMHKKLYAVVPVYSFEKSMLDYIASVCKKNAFVMVGGKITSGFKDREKLRSNTMIQKSRLYLTVLIDELRLLEKEAYMLRGSGVFYSIIYQFTGSGTAKDYVNDNREIEIEDIPW